MTDPNKKPLAIDLYAGLGGWAEGFLAEGFEVIGFDIERHEYWMPETASGSGDGGEGTKPVAKRGWTQGCAITLGIEGANSQPRTKLMKYPGQLVLQDIRTIHGSQFRNADIIVASPPCTEFSYMAMPWKRAKQIAAVLRGNGEFPEGYKGSRTIAELTVLFDACFRIQREASEAAGHHIPMIVENVRGAQPWVGRSAWNFGSFHLWGDVPALMPIAMKTLKGFGGTWFHNAELGTTNPNRSRSADLGEIEGRKVPGMNFHDYEKTGRPGRSFQTAAVEGLGLCGKGMRG